MDCNALSGRNKEIHMLLVVAIRSAVDESRIASEYDVNDFT